MYSIVFEENTEKINHERTDEVTVLTLKKHLDTNFNLYHPVDYEIIKMFFDEEEQYVHHLETLECQKYDLSLINVPYYDLENLFGCITEIKNFHKYDLPKHAVKCTTIEEIFRYFIDNRRKLRWYILDQFKKFQTKFHGKKALYKRFYQSNIDYSLTLPERRIISLMKIHSYISTIEYLKDSLVLYNSSGFFNELYVQMQYVKQLAAIQNISSSICYYCDVLCIENFQISIDGSPQNNYRVYCLDKFIFVTSLMPESKMHMHKIDYNIPNTKISFSGNNPEDLNFELQEYLEGNKKRTFIFTAENGTIKSKWVDVIQNILYKQLIEEKYKAKTP